MMSAETRLLVLCSKLETDSEQEAEVQNILDLDLDWSEVLVRADDEGVTPLLYKKIRLHSQKVPEEVLSKLHFIYIRNAARNLYLLTSLKPLLEAVEESGLRAALIKGARLVNTLYKDIGARFFIDVDLLVYPPHRKSILKLLSGLGFVQTFSPHVHHALSEREKMFWTFRPAYKKGNLELELHYNFPGLHMPFSMTDDLWQNTKKIDIEDSPAQVLSPEYELCLLCLHSQQHSYSRLDWFTDIAGMVRSETLHWSKVLSICRKERIQASVFYGLYLVNQFWPKTVPEKVLDGFYVSRLEKNLLEFFWPLHSVKSRGQRLVFPMHSPTFFSVLSRKRADLFLKAVYHFFLPPRSWVSFYYGISPNSYKMVVHYLWRFWRPVYLVFRRLIEAGP
ncbi:MAG: hypothetical protein GF421_13160 [Candidatus Aminicenantes bacterium]|nr:hypothetical protein [Candidatus Aminicenantes bacterium]